MPARIRYAIRSLSKAPLVSLVVVLSLALGIGANTAIFSLLHQVILNSLPVERPHELVLLTAPGDTKGGRNSTSDDGGMEYIFSYPMFRELEKRPEGLTGLAAFRGIGANLAHGAQTVSGAVLLVSGGYFPMGTLTFELFDPSSTQVDTETVSVSGNGSYDTPTGFTLPSDPLAGTWDWEAIYSGDANNLSVVDPLGNEPVTVAPPAPEPSSIAIFAVALVGLGYSLRQRARTTRA